MEGLEVGATTGDENSELFSVKIVIGGRGFCEGGGKQGEVVKVRYGSLEGGDAMSERRRRRLQGIQGVGK